MKLPILYRRRWWLMYLPIVLAALAAMFWASIAWKPLPPQRVVIGTGPAQSSYLRLAQVYAARLERMGLAVDIVTHPKPQDALDRLLQPGSGIDVTFAQGLYARPGQNVQALAAVGHEIVWVFARQSVQNLAQLRGMRIAAADVGSSNRLAADLLLAHLRLKPGDVQFERLVGDAAIAALAENRVDAVVHVATGESVTLAWSAGKKQGSDSDSTDEFTVSGVLDTGGSEDALVILERAGLEGLTGEVGAIDVVEYSVATSADQMSAIVTRITESTPGVAASPVKRLARSETTVLATLSSLLLLVTVSVCTGTRRSRKWTTSGAVWLDEPQVGVWSLWAPTVVPL